jgi:ATP-dependent DNA ligase
MRLHPAESRVRKLSVETPATLMLFDCLLTPNDPPLTAEPLVRRRAALEGFFAGLGGAQGLALSPYTRDRSEAQGWLEHTGEALDGVVAKRLDGPYEPGERAMLKIKRLRTADCVVGGFRYESASRRVGSLLLGLYNEAGLLDHVGFTSSIAAADRDTLTAKLEGVRGPPGFTGKAPGGPSRWSTDRSGDWESLRSELVVEVRYDHAAADRFRHGTKLMRWRPDKAPRQCTFDQLTQEVAPAFLGASLGAG